MNIKINDQITLTENELFNILNTPEMKEAVTKEIDNEIIQQLKPLAKPKKKPSYFPIRKNFKNFKKNFFEN
jgi:hypothetical protein